MELMMNRTVESVMKLVRLALMTTVVLLVGMRTLLKILQDFVFVIKSFFWIVKVMNVLIVMKLVKLV
jgi:hypothetical protein